MAAVAVEANGTVAAARSRASSTAAPSGLASKLTMFNGMAPMGTAMPKGHLGKKEPGVGTPGAEETPEAEREKKRRGALEAMKKVLGIAKEEDGIKKINAVMLIANKEAKGPKLWPADTKDYQASVDGISEIMEGRGLTMQNPLERRDINNIGGA
ncbi:MAG: hypothetical protein LBD43_01285, partial [Holosporales bacterium]|nr:hypothetical protein [Holosporales bacterium]